MDWCITLPKTVEWSDYEKEIERVKDGSEVMNYRLPFKVSAKPGDRCFVTWRGKIRGWMPIVGVVLHEKDFECTTTKQIWYKGFYIQRSGPFHKVDGPLLPGFRGIRRIDVDLFGA